MHALFIYLSISFAGGIVFNYYFRAPFIYPLIVSIWSVPLLFLFRNEKKFLCSISITFFLLGSAYEGVYLHVPHDHISYYRAGKYACIGIVDSAVEVKTYSEKKTITTFHLSVQKVRVEKNWEYVTGTIKVNLYNTQKKIHYGDKLKIWGQLAAPAQATNPGQFDYQDYLKKYSIHTLLRSYGNKGIHIYSHGHRNALVAIILQVRNTIKKKIDGTLPYPFNTLLAALLLGFRSEIPSYIRDSFVKTGTVHLLAISGLHISIVTAALYYVCTVLRVHRIIRAGISIFFMIMYTILAGFRFPVQRAALMGGLIITGMALDRKKSIKNIFFLAFLILIMITPESLFLAGFQLSFITVFSIIILTPPIMNMLVQYQEGDPPHTTTWGGRVRRYILTGYAVSIAVMLGASVLIVYLFNIFSPISLFANIIIVPCSAVSIITGIIFIMVSFINETCAQISAYVPLVSLKLMVGIIRILCKIPWSFFYIRTPHMVMVFLYYAILVLFFLLKKKYFGRYLIVWISGVWVVFIIIFCLGGGVPECTMNILDAQSHTIVFMKTIQDGNMLINTGGGKRASTSRWVLKPFLMSQGINMIHNIVLTSFYKKHRGGLPLLADNFTINRILLPAWDGWNDTSLYSNGMTRKIATVMFEEDAVIDISPNITMYVLHGPQNTKTNTLQDSVVVVKVVYKKMSFLLCPEITPVMMDTLLRKSSDTLNSDILIIAHTLGAFGSVEKLFLEAVSPRYVIMAGTRYEGSTEVSTFVQSLPYTVYSTGTQGCIRLTYNASSTPLVHVQSFLKDTNPIVKRRFGYSENDS